MWNLIHYRRLGIPQRHSGEFRRSTRQEADRQSNGQEGSDLFWALKGGCINFGIVCRFDLERKNALLKPMEDLAGEARGAGGVTDVGQDTPRFGLFEISAFIVQGKLRFPFTFNRNIRHRDGIGRWTSGVTGLWTSLQPD
jgi:hypothetical protein